MKTARYAMVAAIATAVALFVVTEAPAQFGGGMGGMGGMGGKRGARMGTDKSNPGASRAAQENMTDVVSFRLAQLQEDLKLTREQEALWATYEDRTEALATDLSRERSRVQSAVSLNAIEQVNHAVDMARDRLTAWEDIASAAKTLYAALTPQQKTLVDQKFPSIVSALEPGGSITTAARP